MSAAATAWAWRQTAGSIADRKLVLLALAEDARLVDGRQRHDVQRIAERCMLTGDAVLAAVVDLQGAGLLRWNIGESNDKVLSIELKAPNV